MSGLSSKTKYLLVSLTALGHLRIEEDRGVGVIHGAQVETVDFLDGARHSVYYRRKGDDALLLVYPGLFRLRIDSLSPKAIVDVCAARVVARRAQVDRVPVALRSLNASIDSDGLANVTDGDAIHIGGVQTSDDPRFTHYDYFDGCLSSNKAVFILLRADILIPKKITWLPD